MSEQIYLEKSTGEKYLLTNDKYILGRNPACDIVFQKSTVSAKHAELYKRTNGWCIRDLHSKNGTEINGERLIPGTEYPVFFGDEILLAKQIRILIKCKIDADYKDVNAGNQDEKNDKDFSSQFNQKVIKVDGDAGAVIMNILPVLDSIEFGIKAYQTEKANDPYLAGLQKILKQALNCLQAIGVYPIESIGKPFDPNIHNAVAHVNDPKLPKNVVKEVTQTGYMYKGKIIRYASVIVAN